MNLITCTCTRAPFTYCCTLLGGKKTPQHSLYICMPVRTQCVNSGPSASRCAPTYTYLRRSRPDDRRRRARAAPSAGAPRHVTASCACLRVRHRRRQPAPVLPRPSSGYRRDRPARHTQRRNTHDITSRRLIATKYVHPYSTNHYYKIHSSCQL